MEAAMDGLPASIFPVPDNLESQLVPEALRQEVTALLGTWPRLEPRCQMTSFGRCYQLVSSGGIPGFQNFSSTLSFLLGSTHEAPLFACGAEEIDKDCSSSNFLLRTPRILFLLQQVVPVMHNVKRGYAEYMERKSPYEKEFEGRRANLGRLAQLAGDLEGQGKGAGLQLVYAHSDVPGGGGEQRAREPFGFRHGGDDVRWFATAEALESALVKS
jgi:hypothetical protein